MKCVICEQRKPKRFCPAKKASICPQCCGEKRVLEIDCPESCEYLKAGRESEVAGYTKRLYGGDQAALEKNRRTLREHQAVVAHLEYTVARERLSSRDLTDQDVSRAIGLLLETYRTEDNGILFEKTSEDLRVEPLRRALRRVIEDFRNPDQNQGTGIVDPTKTRLALAAAMDCLEFVGSMAMAFRDRKSGTGYVDFLARITPREDRKSSIIMP